MENKTKRKVFAATASAALVASTVVPAASFAETNVSFPDLKGYEWATDAINYLIKKGALNGYEDGTFRPANAITRGEAAKILAIALDLDVDLNAKTDFADAKDHWSSPYIAAIVNQTNGVINGYEDGTFRPDRNITRQEMAKMVVTAYDLKLNEEADVSFNDNNGWGKEYVEILASLGIVQGRAAGQFAPEASVNRAETTVFVHRTEVPSVRVEVPKKPPVSGLNVKSVTAITATSVTVEISELAEDMQDANVTVRNAEGQVVPTQPTDLKAGATTATFNFVTPLTVNPTSQWTVNGVAYAPAEFAIVSVEALTTGAKYIEVQFNKPIDSLHVSEVNLRETISLARVGIESVDLSLDRMSAQITLLGDEEKGVLERLKSYTLSLTQNGKVTSFDFTLPLAIEEEYITSVDAEDRVIVINGQDITVPENYAFDFEYALARQATVWVNKDWEMVNHQFVNQTVKYDAIEVKVDGNTRKLDLKTDGGTVNLASDALISVNGGAWKSANTLKDEEKFDYAKVVYNNNNRAQYVVAYDWNDFILVEGTDGDVVYGYGDEQDFKDYTLVKDGRTISISDLEKGDMVFFNADAEYGEVYNNTVTGEIERIYETEVNVNGKNYKYSNSNIEQRARYINEDGDIEALPTNTSDIEDIFKAMRDAGEVTLYVDRYGGLVFISGDLEELVYSSSYSLVTAELVELKGATREPIYNIEVLDANGKEYSFDIKKSDLEDVFGESDYTKISFAKPGNIVDVKLDKNGKLKQIVELNNSVTLKDQDKIKKGDRYFKGKEILNNAVVYLAEDVTDWTDFDIDDISVTTYSKLSFDEITGGTVYTNDKDQIIAIVVTDSDRADAEQVKAVVTSAPVKLVGENTWRIKLYIPGHGDQWYYTEADKDVLKGLDIKKGDFLFVNFETDKDGELTEIVSVNHDYDTKSKINVNEYTDSVTVKSVSTQNRTITGNDDKVWRLDSGALILDENYKPTNLSNIKTGDKLEVFKVDKGSSFVEIVVIKEKADNGDKGNKKDPVAETTIYAVKGYNKTFNRFDVEDRDGNSLKLYVEDFDGFAFTDGTNQVSVTEDVMTDWLKTGTNGTKLEAIVVTKDNVLVIEDAPAYTKNFELQAVEAAKKALEEKGLEFDKDADATSDEPKILKPDDHSNGSTYTLEVDNLTGNNDGDAEVDTDGNVVITRDTNGEFTFDIEVTVKNGDTTVTIVFKVTVPTGEGEVTITLADDNN